MGKESERERKGEKENGHLWTIEGTISWIQRPWMIKFLQRFFKLLQQKRPHFTTSPSPQATASPLTHLLCPVPERWISHKLLRPCGEVELERETKHAVDVLQKVEASTNLISDLA